MNNIAFLGLVLLGFLCPLPEDIYGAWKWWTKKEDIEFPPPPPLTRQDGAIFDVRASEVIEYGPNYFVSQSTIHIINRTRVLPRTISTDLSELTRPDPAYIPSTQRSMDEMPNNQRSPYISWMCLCCRSDR